MYLFWDGAQHFTFLGSCVELRGQSIVLGGQAGGNGLTITDVPEI